MQLDIFGTPGADARSYSISNGELVLYPAFYGKDMADEYFALLKEQTPWKQETISIYGKTMLTPRLTAWYGDTGADYHFSNTKYTPHAWTPTLQTIRKDINKVEPAIFNSVLLNLYRNGNDSVSWHTDAEPELGRNPTIASVNFGAARRFMLRRIDDHTQKLDILLTHGSLLLMKGELQHYWQHQVPKTAAVVTERINLTYRMIYGQG